MPTSNNKSKRRFDFDKPQKRTFDFSKDDDEIPKHTKPWYNKPCILTTAFIILCLLVCLLCYIGYNYFSKSDNKAVERSVIETVEATNNDDNAETSIEQTNVENSENSPNVPQSSSDDVETIMKASEPINEQMTATKFRGIPAETVPSLSDTKCHVNISNDIEAEAIKVIRGDYGLGQERKDKLGAKYQIIQSRVNELKREGIF